MEVLPLSITDVKRATREDPVFGKLFNAVRCGQLDSGDKDLARFSGVFSNLYIGDEVLYFGTRVVIPTVQQQGLLEELHFSHIGTTKMKETIRRYFWYGRKLEFVGAHLSKIFTFFFLFYKLKWPINALIVILQYIIILISIKLVT